MDEDKWQKIGCAYPDLTLGWTNTFRYKGLSLAFTLRSAIGGLVFNQYRAEFENVNQIGLKNILASWLDDTGFTGEIRYSSKYIEKASYLKLDNLTLAYEMKFKTKYINGYTANMVTFPIPQSEIQTAEGRFVQNVNWKK